MVSVEFVLRVVLNLQVKGNYEITLFYCLPVVIMYVNICIIRY